MSNGTRKVILRRGGQKIREIETDADGTRRAYDVLTVAEDGDQMLPHITEALAHLTRVTTDNGDGQIASTINRREDQSGVLAKTAIYLGVIVELLIADMSQSATWARILQPPRTGKTVIMGEIIGATGATALILAPTLALVDQHREGLTAQLPTVRIGVLTGEERNPVSTGITIATYDTLLNLHRQNKVPAWLRHVTFVFADEGHEAMTELRLGLLRDAFHPACIRIACTATPDYNKRRTLATHFPYLISEITLTESYRLNLLAKFDVWAEVVDVDASQVVLKQGDYDQAEYGRLMSSAPVFETVRKVRYEKTGNAERACLVCCTSKQQALDLRKFLLANRPAGTPAPEIIFGDTEPEERRRLLRAFERGSIDTLINVGVLLRGWNSKRCKLLIDLCLSLSLVRSKQKYFRPLTKDGDARASIWLVVPKNLPRDPILPSVVFGASVRETWVGEAYVPVTTKSRPTKPTTPNSGPRTRIKHVAAESRTVLAGVGLPTLDPGSPAEVRKVIDSVFTVTDRLPRYGEFTQAVFHHELFGGWGSTLLRFCGVFSSTAYRLWATHLYPEAAATELLVKEGLEIDRPVQDDVDYLLGMINSGEAGEAIADGWRALFGPDEADGLTPEQAFLLREEWDGIETVVHGMAPELQAVFRRRRMQNPPDTYAEIATDLGVSTTTVMNREREAAEVVERRRRPHLHRAHLAWLQRIEECGFVYVPSMGVAVRRADVSEVTSLAGISEAEAQASAPDLALAKSFYRRFLAYHREQYPVQRDRQHWHAEREGTPEAIWHWKNHWPEHWEDSGEGRRLTSLEFAHEMFRTLLGVGSPEVSTSVEADSHEE